MGIQNQGKNKQGGKPSRYAEYILQDGTKLSISIRASAHNANADNYLEHQPVPDINLSILLQKKMRKNKFKSNPLVNLGEFVYVNKKIKEVKDPLTKMIVAFPEYRSQRAQSTAVSRCAIFHSAPMIP